MWLKIPSKERQLHDNIIGLKRNMCSKELLLLVVLCVSVTNSYRSINEYYFNIGKEEHLYDTGTLPESELVTVFLFHNEPQSFFFPVEGHSSPVSISVIPCSSSIEWKLYFHEQNYDKRMDNTLQGDPLFIQEGKLGGEVSGPSIPRHLHTYQGKDMTTFTTSNHLPKGILRVALLAKEANTRIQLYASSNLQTEQPEPVLPENSAVDIVANDKSSVTVAWKPSPSHKQWGQHIKYCVTFNPRHSYRTMCALHADLDGQLPPPAWPRYAGFGFPWENAAKNRIASLRRHLHKSREFRRDIHLECVGGRHWASVTSLLADRKYYVDVFAINDETNRSTTYSGATFVTPGRAPLPVLRSGMLTVAHVGGSLGSQVTYGHELKAPVKKLTVFLQTCSTDIVADVIYEGAVSVRNVPIVGLHKINLRNAEPGNYSIRLTMSSDEGLKVPVTMCLVGKSRKCPYNGVPSNRVINATKNIASCRSVTLQWPSADSHAKYCLYKTTLAHDYDPLLFTDHDDNCSPSARQDKPLFCRVYKKTSPQRHGKTLVETVWNLKPKVKYEFRLQAFLRQGVSVTYEPVVIDMEEKC